jgi:hypothetical protein
MRSEGHQSETDQSGGSHGNRMSALEAGGDLVLFGGPLDGGVSIPGCSGRRWRVVFELVDQRMNSIILLDREDEASVSCLVSKVMPGTDLAVS